MLTFKIPAKYYRAMKMVKEESDKRTDRGRKAYDLFCHFHDFLVTWLWEQAPGPHRFIGLAADGEVTLEPDKENPFAVYWTHDVQRRLSAQFGLAGLWDLAMERGD